MTYVPTPDPLKPPALPPPPVLVHPPPLMVHETVPVPADWVSVQVVADPNVIGLGPHETLMLGVTLLIVNPVDADTLLFVASPLYVAVIVWPPAPMPPIVKVALLPLRGTVAWETPSTKNVMVPRGLLPPLRFPVNVTALPYETVDGDALTEIEGVNLPVTVTD